LAFSRAALRQGLATLDRRGLTLARTVGHTAGAERAVAAFSRTGEHAAIWLLGGAVAAVCSRNRRPWLVATAAVACAYVANTAIKFTVRRPRPNLEQLPPLTSTPSGLSFPSAHTTTSVVAASLYGRLGLPKPALRALAAAFAYSRIYLGVHYPSDLVGGALLGKGIARLARPALERALAEARR